MNYEFLLDDSIFYIYFCYQELFIYPLENISHEIFVPIPVYSGECKVASVKS